MIRRSMLLALSLGTLSLVAAWSIDLPTQLLPVYGGSSGTAFTRSCGAGRVLTGLRGREGLLVDAVGLLCKPVNPDGTLGSQTTVGSLAGGGGGRVVVKSCNAGEVVSGGHISSGSFVDGIGLLCRPWSPNTRTFDKTGAGNLTSPMGRYSGRIDISTCGSAKQPVSGIRGRAAGVVDAFGLICDEP